MSTLAQKRATPPKPTVLSSMARTSTRTRSRLRSCAKAAMCGTGSLLSREDTFALGGQSSKCVTATCPAYTGIIVFLLVIYGFFVSLIWAFRPYFTLKAGASSSDANSVDLTAGFLYSLLFTGLVLVLIALIVRCGSCKQ